MLRRIIASLIGLLVITALLFMFGVRWKNVNANQRGVKVGINGVNTDPVQPGSMRLYCPMITQFYLANVGQQRFVMNDTAPSDDPQALGRTKDEFKVLSKDNQDMFISVEVQWHRDPAKVVEQQRLVGDVSDDVGFVEKVLRQPVKNYTKNYLTSMDAIDAYSGPAHVKAQMDIQTELQTDSALNTKGCVIDNYLVEIRLDEAYTKPIKDRQVAIQTQLAYAEQTKASESAALKAKADAQADLNTRVVSAEAAKEVAILQADQNAQTVILTASGAKMSVVLAAEGEKEAAQNKADAILAVGQANAASSKLQYAAYAAPGADVYARIQCASYLSNAYSGVRGWIPEHMTINTFADSFLKGVSSIVSPSQSQPPQPTQ